MSRALLDPAPGGRDGASVQFRVRAPGLRLRASALRSDLRAEQDWLPLGHRFRARLPPPEPAGPTPRASRPCCWPVRSPVGAPLCRSRTAVRRSVARSPQAPNAPGSGGLRSVLFAGFLLPVEELECGRDEPPVMLEDAAVPGVG